MRGIGATHSGALCAARILGKAAAKLELGSYQVVTKKKVPNDWKRWRKPAERPDLSEAIVAAQSITDRIDGQIEIAASLMGMSEDEVRQAVLQAKPLPSTPLHKSHDYLKAEPRPVVVLERRSRRTIPIGPESRSMTRRTCG